MNYIDLEHFIAESKLPVFGTLWMAIYKSVLPQEGILIMGNEANGISLN
jgi:TrmH family RNA methyltransferase